MLYRVWVAGGELKSSGRESSGRESSGRESSPKLKSFQESYMFLVDLVRFNGICKMRMLLQDLC